MSNAIIIPNTTLDYNLSLAATRVLIALAEFRDENGESILSTTALADYTNLSNRSVRRGIEELVKVGLISKRSRYYFDGGCATNAYRIYA